jgi:hypothetical protein
MSALEIGRPPVARYATAGYRAGLVVLAATLVMAMGRPASSRAGDSQSYRRFARAQRD